MTSARQHDPSKWWHRFDRIDVIAALESATGQALPANDPLPDSLIANAEALGLLPMHLRMFIYDEPKREDWSHDAMARWAAAQEFREGAKIEKPNLEKPRAAGE